MEKKRTFADFHPSKEEIDYYQKKWNENPKYVCAEAALKRLFVAKGPQFLDESDLMIKCSTLNDFYGTHIYDIYPVVKRYMLLGKDLEERLVQGELCLVDDLKNVTFINANGTTVEKHLYSFASKFCSHHNPDAFPIYDYYVDKILKELRNQRKELSFKNTDLTNYNTFVGVINQFRKVYGLEEYSYKQIDMMLWQAGKEFFPQKY